MRSREIVKGVVAARKVIKHAGPEQGLVILYLLASRLRYPGTVLRSYDNRLKAKILSMFNSSSSS